MIPNNYPAYITEDQFVDFWKEYLDTHEWKPKEDLSLYIHYPWCQSVCKFCVFGNLALKDGSGIIEKYEDATLRLLGKIGNVIKDSPKMITDLSFGGGTASLWDIEKMMKMTELIPMYNAIPLRKMEAHPITLYDQLIDIYADEMKFHQISLGVQSFNEKANKDQRRIYTPIDQLKRTVKYIQSKGMFVNIDLICMFNGDTDEDWDIFREDMAIATGEIEADSITIYPNYKSSDYIGMSKCLRTFINGILTISYHLCPGSWRDLLPIETEDIIKFADSPYVIRTIECQKFFESRNIYQARCGNNPNVIGIGGVEKMYAFSSTADMDAMQGMYNQWEDEFLYLIRKNDIFGYLRDDNVERLAKNGFTVGHQEVDIRNQ